MRTVAIVEFWIIACLIFIIVLMYFIASKMHKENNKLKIDIIQAKNECEYTKKIMELKDASYKNVKEKNSKLDEGSRSDRINAAGDILCNKNKK